LHLHSGLAVLKGRQRGVNQERVNKIRGLTGQTMDYLPPFQGGRSFRSTPGVKTRAESFNPFGISTILAILLLRYTGSAQRKA
jgi:hypothetical protein